jgi:type I restriction enzyme S subunit
MKIYAFIEAFNKIIALQQRHVEQLKQSKQGFLQKMFPKDDELVPEIRFDGFSGKWKRKILSQVLSPGNKLAVSDTSAYKRITVKLNKRGVEEAKSDRKLADTRPFYQRYSGELIIGKQNYFNGSIAIVPKDFDGYICSNAIMSFSVVNDDLYFVYSQISQSDYICRHSHIADGTGQKELSEKKFLKFAVLIPELAEQQKIGEFFKQLDDLIAKNERELELLQETKKGFLQKMFV